MLAALAIAPIYFSFGSIAAAITIGASFLTDFIDGKLARGWHVESFLGSLLDSVSDKALAASSLITLSLVNPLFLIPLLLEVGILTTNVIAAKSGENIQSNMLGKIKEWFLGLGAASGFALTAPNIAEKLTETTQTTYLNTAALTSAIACGATLASYCASYYSAHKDRLESLQIEQNLADIKSQKEALRKLKTRPEILHDLIDTEFYHTHKNDPILSLLYKEKPQN